MSNGITIQEYTKRNPFNSKPFALRNSEEFMEAVKFNNHDLVEQALKVNKKLHFILGFCLNMCIFVADK